MVDDYLQFKVLRTFPPGRRGESLLNLLYLVKILKILQMQIWEKPIGLPKYCQIILPYELVLLMILMSRQVYVYIFSDLKLIYH